LLLAMLAHGFDYGSGGIDAAALAMVALAAGLKLAYWNMIAKSASESTAASATGLGKPGLVRLLDAPHTESNYLMQEMGYRVARKHAARLRVIAAITLFAIPLMLLTAALAGASIPATFLLAAAAISAATGILVERWLFFAEAKHTVTLYYGEEYA
jgi:DMSO reductase anchor subunit